MQHSQNTSVPDSPQTLPNFSLAEATGPDAAAFLQSQLSSDVSALRIGHWHWSAWLSAKGRVVALILLLRTSSDSFMLLLPDHPASDLVPALGRYVLRRKLTLRAVEDQAVVGSVGAECSHSAEAPSIELGGPLRRRLFITPSSSAPPPASREFASTWNAEDLRAGVPRLPPEGGTHTAHMLSLDRLGAISLSKGCYPGQEIVARTHYLGQSKRGIGLLQIETDTAPELGSAVSLADANCGEILRAECIGPRRVLAQAVLAQPVLQNFEDAALQVDGHPCILLALSPPPLPPPGRPG